MQMQISGDFRIRVQSAISWLIVFLFSFQPAFWNSYLGSISFVYAEVNTEEEIREIYQRLQPLSDLANAEEATIKLLQKLGLEADKIVGESTEAIYRYIQSLDNDEIVSRASSLSPAPQFEEVCQKLREDYSIVKMSSRAFHIDVHELLGAYHECKANTLSARLNIENQNREFRKDISVIDKKIQNKTASIEELEEKMNESNLSKREEYRQRRNQLRMEVRRLESEKREAETKIVDMRGIEEEPPPEDILLIIIGLMLFNFSPIVGITLIVTGLLSANSQARDSGPDFVRNPSEPGSDPGPPDPLWTPLGEPGPDPASTGSPSPGVVGDVSTDGNAGTGSESLVDIDNNSNTGQEQENRKRPVVKEGFEPIPVHNPGDGYTIHRQMDGEHIWEVYRLAADSADYELLFTLSDDNLHFTENDRNVTSLGELQEPKIVIISRNEIGRLQIDITTVIGGRHYRGGISETGSSDKRYEFIFTLGEIQEN